MAFHSPRGNPLLWLVAVVAAGCTAFYMTRLMAMTFWGASRVPKETHPHEAPPTMYIPLIVLAVLSVFAGWLGVPHGLATFLPGHPSNILEGWLEHIVRPVPGLEHGSLSLEMTLMAVSVLLAGVSAFVAYYMYAVKPNTAAVLARSLGPLHRLVANKYYVDEIYQKLFIQPLISLSRIIWSKADVGVIDRATYKVSDFVRSAGEGLRSLQTGQLQTYTLMIVMGVVATLLLMMM